MVLAGVYQMKYCDPESIVSVCNDNRNYFHGCTCQQWGQCVSLFGYQCNGKISFGYSWGNGNGCSFPCKALICIGARLSFVKKICRVLNPIMYLICTPKIQLIDIQY